MPASRLPFLRFVLLFAALLVGSCGRGPALGPVVLAPASMQQAVEAFADTWQDRGHARPVVSIAGTPALARQLAEGVPADIVITADSEWMDWLESRDLTLASSRRDIAGNSLVYVWRDARAAPRSGGGMGELAANARRIAMADPESVPAGRYARSALETAGIWSDVRGHIVPTEHVLAALRLVESGEADLGIVYASDLYARDGFSSAPLPGNDSLAVRYPAALAASPLHDDAEALLDFMSGDEGRGILCEFGFVTPPRTSPC